jgi:hypothetical protein
MGSLRQGTACGAAVRTGGPCPLVRLKRPVEAPGSSRSLHAAVAVAVLALAGGSGARAAPPPPFRPTGGLAFGAAAPIDPASTSVQPNLAVGDDGTIWLSSSTLGRTVFVRRSTDDGRSFRAASPTGVGPQGDTALALGDGGALYAVAQDSGSGVGAALSTDGGASWTQTRFFVPGAIDGRVSLAVDRGPTSSPADDTVFLVVHFAGAAYLYSSPGGSLEFTNAAGGVAIGTGRCGGVLFDPVQRNLYLPCGDAPRVAIITGHVPLGQRVGLTFRTFVTPATPGGGAVSQLLPAAAVDRAGTVYAVWSDVADHNVYYAASPDGGASWRGPVRVNGNEARSTALPVAVGGAPGVLAIAWLGADTSRGAADIPAFSANPASATGFRWYGYAAVVTGAASPGQSIIQQRFTAKPIHFGRVSDPSLGQYLAAALNRDGGLVLAYDDTTSQHHAAHLFATRELAGPTPLGTSIVEPSEANPVSDPAGDAPAPELDLRRVELVQDQPTRLRVLMTLGAPPTADTSGLWLARFQVLSTGVRGTAAYRILYLGAQKAAGGAPTFFGGTTTCSNLECSVVSYPATVPAVGSVDGDTITVDVALEGGFGKGFPFNGDLLYNVVGLTFAPVAGATGTDIDSTAPFDYRLEERIGRTTSNGRHVVGAGSIRGAGSGRATFRVDVFQAKTGRIVFSDQRARIAFRSRQITRVRVLGRHRVRIWASGSGGSCVATFVDGGEGRRRDSFSIVVGRYRRSGRLLSGGVTIK